MDPQEVMPTAFEKPGEPLALVVEESGCPAIAGWVPDVVLLMRDVEVTTEQCRLVRLDEPLGPHQHVLYPSVLVRLAFGAGRAVRQVHVDTVQIPVLGMQDPAVGVGSLVQLGVDTSSDLAKADSRAGHHARVALLLGRVPYRIVALRGLPLIGHLLRQRPDLLEQPDISVDSVGEVTQALAMSSSDAIEVPSGDSHSLALL